MRRRNCPPVALASRKLNKAVRKDPKCRAPVGDGAKRVLTGTSGRVCDGFRWSCPVDITRPEKDRNVLRNGFEAVNELLHIALN